MTTSEEIEFHLLGPRQHLTMDDATWTLVEATLPLLDRVAEQAPAMAEVLAQQDRTIDIVIYVQSMGLGETCQLRLGGEQPLPGMPREEHNDGTGE